MSENISENPEILTLKEQHALEVAELLKKITDLTRDLDIARASASMLHTALSNR